jgi:hypothetical protein
MLLMLEAENFSQSPKLEKGIVFHRGNDLPK